VKTLEIERKGFLSAKETENKSNTSREESLLDKIEAFLASLIKQQTQQQLGSGLGSVSTDFFNTNLNNDKLSSNYDVLIKNEIRVEIKPNKQSLIMGLPSQNSKVSNKWVLDSGATDHMIRKPNIAK
jgi:hypothetical protein